MKFQMTSGDTLTAVLAGAITTTNPHAAVGYQTDHGEFTSRTALNGVTAVTLFTGQQHNNSIVKELSIYNGDTAAVTVTLKHVVDGTSYTIGKFILQVSDTLVIDANGPRAIDTNGQVRAANATTVPVTLTGPVNGLWGADTAAAGTTTADAGALPAATGNCYDVTGADDTVGVILNAAEKVTGRTIFIGNAVSNKILKIYPPTGGTINGAAANAAFSTASGKGATLVCKSAGANSRRAS